MLDTLNLDGGHANMYSGGMVDGRWEISAEVYDSKGEWLITIGWQLDPTSFHQDGIPQHVIDDIKNELDTS